MKILFAITLAYILTNQSVLAETSVNCDRSQHIVEQLRLKEEQVEPVTKILEQQRQQRKALMQEQRQQMKDKMDSLHQDTIEQLSAFLDQEQLKLFEAIRQKRQERMQQRWQRHKHGKHDTTAEGNQQVDRDIAI